MLSDTMVTSCLLVSVLFHSQGERRPPRFGVPEETALSLGFASDGRSILAHCRRSYGEILDSETGAVQSQIMIPRLPATAVFIDNTATRIVLGYGGRHGMLEIWNTVARPFQLSHQASGAYVNVVCLSPCHRFLAAGYSDGMCRIINIESNKATEVPPPWPQTVSALAFVGANKMLAVGYATGEARFLDQDRKTIVRTATPGMLGKRAVSAFADLPETETLVAGNVDGTLSTYRYRDGQVLSKRNLDVTITGIAVSPDRSVLAVGLYSGQIELLSIPGLEEIKALGEEGSPVFSVAFSPDGKSIASSNLETEVMVWDVTKHKLKWKRRLNPL